MPWCHTCRTEYRESTPACPECRGQLVDAPPPERRLSAFAGERYVVVATLPPAQALAASERLDLGGIPNALRDVGNGSSADMEAVDVLVSPGLLGRARAVVRGRKPRSTIGMWMFIATAALIFMSSAIVIARWIATGSPLP